MQALSTDGMKVGGADLMRANIHIEDMADVYIFLLEHPELVGIYNAAFENYSLGGIAEEIKKRTKAKIEQMTKPACRRVI